MNPQRLFRTRGEGGRDDMPRPHNPKVFRENFDLINWHLAGQIATIKRAGAGKGPTLKKTP